MILDWAMNSYIWHQKHKKQQKIGKLDFTKLKKCFYRKGYSQENKKTTQKTGENICKSSNMFDIMCQNT